MRGLVACMGRGEVHAGFWWGDLRERDHLGKLGVDGMGRITLERTLNRLGKRELDLSGT